MTRKMRTCPRCGVQQPDAQFQAVRRCWCRSCVHEHRASHGWGPSPTDDMGVSPIQRQGRGTKKSSSSQTTDR